MNLAARKPHARAISLLAWPLIFILLTATILASGISGCEYESSVWEPIAGLRGSAKLESQTDHSGVLVEVNGLDATAVTDSTGFFSFTQIPDGKWQLTARYPYFNPYAFDIQLRKGHLRDPINITLSQLLQFWVAPCSVTVSLSGIEGPHIVLDLWGYVENVGDRVVVVQGASGPARLIAVRPGGAKASDTCVVLYGRLLAGIFPDPFSYPFVPGRIGKFKLYTGLGKSCFPPGVYYVYWAISDESTYPKWLRYDGELNRSLYSKRELLQVATLIVEP